MTRTGIMEFTSAILLTCAVPLLFFPRVLNWLFSPGLGPLLLAAITFIALAFAIAVVRSVYGTCNWFMTGPGAAPARFFISLAGVNLGFPLMLLPRHESRQYLQNNQALQIAITVLLVASSGLLLWHLPWGFRTLVAKLESQGRWGWQPGPRKSDHDPEEQ